MLKLAKSDVGRYEDLVLELLTKHSFLRDDPNALYLACIAAIRGKEYVHTTSLFTFFAQESNSNSLPKVPTMASVIRLNTKVQKENLELRGVDWEKKQAHSKDYKEDLGYGKTR